jgi:hypothetical protein
MLIKDLPDEVIEHILTFVKDRDLGRCRQVNRRLYQIANSPYIVTLFPHISLDGSLYLKEQAYFTPTLRDRILMTTESNDLEWLVSRTTPFFKEVSSTVWFIIISSAYTTSECKATDVYWMSIVDMNSPYKPYYDEGLWAWAVNAIVSSHVEPGSCWYATTDNVWSATGDIVKSITDDYADTIVNIVTELNIARNVHRAVDTYSGRKCYQISECMMLLAINKTLILSIKDIVSRPRTAPLPKAYSHILEKPLFLPKHVLENLKDNPWIKQYMELFQIENDCYPEE